MTIRFLLPKRISKKTGLATLVIRIYDGRDYQKKIWTKLGINSEYWDSKKETIKKGHLNYEDTLAILNKWKTKASYAEKKYTLDRFTRQQVVDHILGKSDFDSILTFIDTVIKETKSNQAYLDYREKYKSFQKVVKPSAELTFDDFLKGSYNLFEKFYLHGKNKVQKEYKWTPITYTSRIEAMGRILSYA